MRLIHGKKGFVLLCILLINLLLSCRQTKKYHYNKYLLGSQCTIKFTTDNDSIAQYILVRIDSTLIRLDSLLNFFSVKSLVFELNQKLRIKAPEDIIQLVLLSDSIARITDGLFDISIAPLLEIWGFYEHEFKNPATADIMVARQLVDYKKIKIRNDSIILLPNMKLDLGGIAQGYAADRVADILKKHNIKSALINIGGEIVAVGCSPEARPWRIGIKNPYGNGLIETVEIEDMALSTSGDYEKFFVFKDQKYPHIINPKTGFPAQNFSSITVFASNAALADAFATAVAIMGPDKGSKFLDSLEIWGIIYYEKDGILQRMEIK
jgi:thiamine biosynthesis lipoprotein